MTSRMLRTTAAAAALTLALTACAGDEGPDATASPVDDVDDPADDGDEGTDDDTTDDDTTDDDTTDDDTTDTSDDSELAGEPYDGPPVHGAPAQLAVVGVAADDVLNVRAGPGADEPVVATLAPLATDVAATGRGRLLTSSIWLEVEVDGVTGWASSSFLGHLGSTTDITAELRELGPLPNAETLLQLADAVAALRASQDPPSRIAVSDGPTVGDLGEVTVDVIGLGDDAVLGERLVIFATEDESGEGFTVRTVEATQLCGRGPGDDEGCP